MLHLLLINYFALLLSFALKFLTGCLSVLINHIEVMDTSKSEAVTLIILSFIAC